MSDALNDLAVLVWNGSAWTSATSAVLETSLRTNGATGAVSNRVFDLAYEATTGDVLVVWGRAATNGFWYATKAAAGTTWTAAAPQAAAPANGAPHFVDLATEPGEICAAFVQVGGVGPIIGATWDRERSSAL